MFNIVVLLQIFEMREEKEVFVFTGKMQGVSDVKVVNFDNEDEARDFANENATDYPIFSVVDTVSGDIVYSNEIADDEEEAIRISMFPDEESEEGFDYTHGN